MYTVIAGESDRAVLYGAFGYLRTLALGNLSADLNERSAPAAPVRWLNHWENVDGTIERGYGGRSIFWEGGRIRDDLSLVDDYGRLLASLGINGLSINNVNANPAFLTLEFLPDHADRRCPAALGRPGRAGGGFREPAEGRQARDLRPPRSRGRRLVEERHRQHLPAGAGSGGVVLKADSEGRSGLGLQAHARRCTT